MAHVRTGARHVASNAAIFLILLQSHGVRQAAASFLMAAQTTCPIIGGLFFDCRLFMRIMAADTAHLVRTFALPETSARIHLLHGTDELGVALLPRRPDKVREE